MAATEPRPSPGYDGTESRTVGEVDAFPMRSCQWCGTLFTARLPTSEESKDYGRYYHAGNLEVPRSSAAGSKSSSPASMPIAG
jgi:hypothetical protein